MFGFVAKMLKSNLINYDSESCLIKKLKIQLSECRKFTIHTNRIFIYFLFKFNLIYILSLFSIDLVKNIVPLFETNDMNICSNNLLDLSNDATYKSNESIDFNSFYSTEIKLKVKSVLENIQNEKITSSILKNKVSNSENNLNINHQNKNFVKSTILSPQKRNSQDSRSLSQTFNNIPFKSVSSVSDINGINNLRRKTMPCISTVKTPIKTPRKFSLGQIMVIFFSFIYIYFHKSVNYRYALPSYFVSLTKLINAFFKRKFNN